jgi:uncharacterized membrane protein
MGLLTVLFLIVGALLSVLALPLIWRRVPPNPWYGFRVRRTLENRDVWYAANAYAGRGLLWSGIATIAAALLLRLLPSLSTDAYALACTAVMGVALALSVGLSFRYLGRLAK